MFSLARTFKKPAKGANAQRGYPAPGEGAQTTGDFVPPPPGSVWTAERPIKGSRSFFQPATPSSKQRGFADPMNAAQARPRGSMPNKIVQGGQPLEVWTPYYDRGAGAIVQNFGKITTNPIGAGIQALNRPQASYGSSGYYEHGMIFWTSQAVPTSVNLQGLTRPEALAAVLGPINVQAAVRVG